MLQKHLVRLACIRHAASVHPEPGSNSPHKYFSLLRVLSFTEFTGLTKNVVSYHSSVVKVLAIFERATSFLPDNRHIQTKTPMHSFASAHQAAKLIRFVSLMEDGLLSCERSVWKTKSFIFTGEC